MTGTTCPSCAGPVMPAHPGGLLEIKHNPVTCALLTAEDATRGADAERRHRYPAGFDRPVTATEAQLLAHLGHQVPAVMHVQHITPGVRRRTWST